MYTWKPFYSELIRAILPYRNRQAELIQILNDIKAKGLSTISLDDKDESGSTIPLSVIDPFTFFANFNRGLTLANNKTILGAIENRFSLKSDVPEDYDGLPAVNPQMSWFFPYKQDRKPGDIDDLWALAEDCIKHEPDQLDQHLFERCLGINTVGSAKLTFGLFWFNPEKYLPVNRDTVNYLRNKNIDIKSNNIQTLAEYLLIIKAVRERMDDVDYVSLSQDIYNFREKFTGKQYWAGGILWDGKISKRDEFVNGDFWQIGWPRNTENNSGKRCWNLFGKIKIGNEFAIKGYGGSHDLTIHYIGQVVDKDSDSGTVRLKRLDRPLYKGDAPRGGGAGNWQNTLIEANRPDVIEKIFGIATSAATGAIDRTSKSETSTKKFTKPERPDIPLNLILYGPPGTGKTYRMKEELAPKFTTEGVTQTEAEFLQEKVSELTWWQVIALVLLDTGLARVTAIHEHKFLKAKDAIMAQQNCRAMIWAVLQSHTVEDCPNVNYSNRNFPLLFSKNAEGTWSIDTELVKNEAPELLRIKEDVKSFKEITKTARRYQFVTFHQSYSYEDFVEGIRPVTSDDDGAITYKVQDGIFKHMVNRAIADPTNFYALFIDEINRANISKVFGELITLVEEDKRMTWNGAEEKWEGGIQANLPYTHAQNPAAPLFGVPANLHIIGTMNTADRSIAFLDTALRRRFDFKEMLPDVSIIIKEGNQFIETDDGEIDLVRLLDTMNRRIEYLYDREHQIGHSYFLGIGKHEYEKLEKVFLNKIIPLLQEYFYDNWEKIQIVFADLKPDGQGDVHGIRENAIIQSRDKELAKDEYLTSVTDQDLITKRLYIVPSTIAPSSIMKIYRG